MISFMLLSMTVCKGVFVMKWTERGSAWEHLRLIFLYVLYSTRVQKDWECSDLLNVYLCPVNVCKSIVKEMTAFCHVLSRTSTQPEHKWRVNNPFLLSLEAIRNKQGKPHLSCVKPDRTLWCYDKQSADLWPRLGWAVALSHLQLCGESQRTVLYSTCVYGRVLGFSIC